MESRGMLCTVLIITMSLQGLSLPTSEEENNELTLTINKTTTCRNDAGQLIGGLNGRDGRDGRDGMPGPPGNDGLQGEKGKKGDTGMPGPPGNDGLQGEKGKKGDTGMPGPSSNDGLQGEKGDTGMTGPAGPPGPTSGGLVYTHWGKTCCPDVSGTQLVYHGKAGKPHYNQGGGVNYQCMPNDPEYSTYRAGVQGRSYMHGVQYRYPIQSGLHDKYVTCAVCHVSTRGAVMMIPAKLTCPTSWTKEYSGYLMTANKIDKLATFECVDSNPESVTGSGANLNGGLFYHVEASCNGLSCPPYVAEKELTCVVCTK